MPNWYSIKNFADNKKAEIYILDQIGKDWWDGSGVTAKGFIDDIKALGNVEQIELHINSPGGDVTDGLTIYNYLKRHSAKVVAYVEGMAASIASVIAMAADELIMPANTTLMIHDPWTCVAGNAEAMRKQANDLDVIKAGLVSAYVDKTGLSSDEISSLMSKETYFTAEEAVEFGFANRLESNIQIAASHDMSKVKAMAKQMAESKFESTKEDVIKNLQTELSEAKSKLLEKVKAAEPTGVIVACHNADLSFLAGHYIERGYTDSQVENQLKQANQIRDLCKAASLDSSIENILSQRDTLNMLRVAITDMQADHDQDINGQLSPGAGLSAEKTINHSDIYSKRTEVN